MPICLIKCDVMGKVTDLKDSEFRDFVEKHKFAFVDFSADWCGPCRMIGPVIKELSEEMEDVAFAKIDVDRERKTATEFGIMSIPTMLIFREGKLADRITGALPKSAIAERLREVMK